MQAPQIINLILIAAFMFTVIGGISIFAHYYTLSGIKSRTVGDGQHGTARFATKKEVQHTYCHVPYKPNIWRRGESRPTEQGLVAGIKTMRDSVTMLVDTGDIHCLKAGA